MKSIWDAAAGTVLRLPWVLISRQNGGTSPSSPWEQPDLAAIFKSDSYYWVYGDGKYSEVVRGRWTPETAATATYPRLTTLDGNNNFRNSTFWLYKTNRFDLAKVQLTYDFPKRLLQKTFLKEAAIYISGSNLLTIAKERELMERNVGTAPQTRFYNLGVKIAF